MVRRVLLLVGALLPAVSLASPTRADANPDQSNCIAVLTSYFGRLQQVDDAAHFLRQYAEEVLGVPFGQLVRAVGSLQGDLEYCLSQVPQP